MAALRDGVGAGHQRNLGISGGNGRFDDAYRRRDINCGAARQNRAAALIRFQASRPARLFLYAFMMRDDTTNNRGMSGS